MYIVNEKNRIFIIILNASVLSVSILKTVVGAPIQIVYRFIQRLYYTKELIKFCKLEQKHKIASYDVLRSAKRMGYPDLGKVEENFAKVPLREKLDHTITRIAKVHPDNFS